MGIPLVCVSQTETLVSKNSYHRGHRGTRNKSKFEHETRNLGSTRTEKLLTAKVAKESLGSPRNLQFPEVLCVPCDYDFY